MIGLQRLSTGSALWIATAALAVIGWAVDPVFLTPRNLAVILFACTLNGLLALGQSLILIVKEIDLSVGANLIFAPMLAIYSTNSLYQLLGDGPTLVGTSGLMVAGWLPVVLLTLLFAVAIGVLNGIIVTKLLVPSFIATIGVAFFLRGMSMVVTNGQPIAFRRLEEAYFLGNATLWGVVPISVLIFVASGLVLAVLCRHTKFGMRIYATGGNQTAARLSGIDTDRWKIIAFALCGLLVGIGAVLFMSRMRGLDIHQTTPFELNSIAIAIIGGISIAGGRGSLIGTMQATLIVAMLLNIFNLLGLGSFYQSAVTGAIIVMLAILYQRRDSARLKQRRVVEA